MDDDHASIVRALKCRLESLARAGLDHLPRPPLLPEVRGPWRKSSGPAKPADPIAEAGSTPRPIVGKPSLTATPPISPPKPPVQTMKPISRAIPTPATTIASLFEAPKMEGTIVPHSERQAALDLIRAEVAACRKCPELCGSRSQTVPGEGNPSPRLMFIGEAPGAEEDRTGRPFVGRAGTLLTDMITKGMGLSREEVFIGNIIKCRPADNRDPTPEETANCLPYLKRQIEIIRPEFLCLLGRISTRSLLETALPLGRMRGRWHRFLDIPTIVTWHPAYLLRNPAAKKDTWDDLQMLMTAMGLKIPERKKPE